jgi:hypothetical protein
MCVCVYVCLIGVVAWATLLYLLNFTSFFSMFFSVCILFIFLEYIFQHAGVWINLRSTVLDHYLHRQHLEYPTMGYSRPQVSVDYGWLCWAAAVSCA